MALIKKRPKRQTLPYSIGEFLAVEVAFFMVLENQIGIAFHPFEKDDGYKKTNMIKIERNNSNFTKIREYSSIFS